MSDDKLYDAIARGSQAKALLESELLAECFNELDRSYIQAWRITPARDTDARERLWQAVNVLGKVRGHLGRVAADGKLAQRQVDELNAREAAKRRS